MVGKSNAKGASVIPDNYVSGSTTYVNGATVNVTCGFRPKLISLRCNNGVNYLMASYDANYTTAQFAQGNNIGAGTLASQTIGSANALIASITDTGFSIYFSTSAAFVGYTMKYAAANGE